jgi:uncharacterized RDD family membrane protein YckC
MLDGKLSLTTPEGIRLLLTPAGPASRAWAWAIDFLIWLVTMWILAMILGGSNTGTGILFLLLFVT